MSEGKAADPDAAKIALAKVNPLDEQQCSRENRFGQPAPLTSRALMLTQLAPYRLNPCLKTGFEVVGGLAV